MSKISPQLNGLLGKLKSQNAKIGQLVNSAKEEAEETKSKKIPAKPVKK